MSFTIPNDLFSAQAECTLTSFQLKSSSLVQNFCSEAIAWAPLCGMMLGRIAAPLIRFRSAQLFSSIGFNQTFSRFTSWGIGVSAEGTIMAATPSVLMGQGISPDLWRGSVHGTFTMMMAQGVARGIPMNGIIREVSQDFSFMAVNVVCGRIGITDQVNGSFMEQYCEARIVSVRMKIGGELVHASCMEATYAQAKYEVQRKVEESGSQGPKGKTLSPLLELAGSNGMRVREKISQTDSAKNSTEQLIRGIQLLFMGRHHSNYRSQERKKDRTATYVSNSLYTYEQTRSLSREDLRSLPANMADEIYKALYANISNVKKRIVGSLERIVKEAPANFWEGEYLDSCHNLYSNKPNIWFPENLLEFRAELQHHILYFISDVSSPIARAIDSLLISKCGVTTPEKVQFLTDKILTLFPEAITEVRTDKKAIIKIPHSNGIDYRVIVQANRAMREIKAEEGISKTEMLRLQDAENDGCNVYLIKKEEKLIVRGSVSRADAATYPGEILIAHTHPWEVEDFLSSAPGEEEIAVARETKNTQVGIYRTTLLIYHSGTQILPPQHDYIRKRRGKITYIPFAPGEDFIISADGNNVLIWPHPDHPLQDGIEVYPLNDISFSRIQEKDDLFTNGDNILIDRLDLVKKVTRKE